MLRSDRLKELRVENGYTQEELGKMINVTKVSICGYEKGNRTPNLETLFDLIRVLKTDINFLIGSDIDVVSDNEEVYYNKISKEELEFLLEIRKNKELYSNMVNDPKRFIELIKTKLK